MGGISPLTSSSNAPLFAYRAYLQDRAAAAADAVALASAPGAPPATSVAAAAAPAPQAQPAAGQLSGVAGGQQYAGDNVYVLSTSSAVAFRVASPLATLFGDATDTVSAVSPVVGTRVDRIA